MLKIPRWLQIVGLGVLAAAVVYLVQPDPVQVETGLVERRDFFEAVEAQGRTRARNPYVITSPVAGRLLRPLLEEGDRVQSGQLLAVVTPSPPDQRMAAYGAAAVAAAEARLAVAEAALEENRSAYARATNELERRERLYRQELASAEETELYRQLAAAEQARLTSAEAAVEAARADIESNRALLLGTGGDDAVDAQIEIKAPVDGTVFSVLEKNERVVQAGMPLMEISNQDSMEVVVDLLTQDAVKIEPGDTVYLNGWGGDQTLNAVVRSIEPEAFTKISALGVEEQRVNVIVDPTQLPDNVGAEYRVEAAIVTWQGNDVLTIPTSAVFQRSNGWNTFVVIDDQVETRPVIIGGRGRDFTRVLGGIEEGARVVLYPSDLINEGVSVRY